MSPIASIKEYKILNVTYKSASLYNQPCPRAPSLCSGQRYWTHHVAFYLGDQERWHEHCPGDGWGIEKDLYKTLVTIKERLTIGEGWKKHTFIETWWYMWVLARCFTYTVSSDNTQNSLWGCHNDGVNKRRNWHYERLSCQDSTACEYQNWDLELDSKGNFFPFATPPTLLFDHLSNPRLFKIASNLPSKCWVNWMPG